MTEPEDRPLSVQSAPAGWVMVPVEPTQEMVERAYEDADTIEERWAVMLSSAPPPPVSELEKALREIAEGGVPRERIYVWNADGSPSKHDMCAHKMRLWEDCVNCTAEYARAALAGGSHDK